LSAVGTEIDSSKLSPRVSIVVDDAPRWVMDQSSRPAASRPTFDLVVIDSTDFSVGGEWSLQTYAQLKLLMRANGRDSIMLANLDSPFLSSAHVSPAVQILTPLFKHVRPYLITQPEFATGSYAFMFCSDGIDPLPSEANVETAKPATTGSAGDNTVELAVTDGVDWMGWERKRLQTRYYNREVHRAAFALPQFFAEAVS
jgi:spermidine synthase